MVANKKRVVGGKDWELGVSGCKLYTQDVNNKVPLKLTGNYIQHPAINRNGKARETCMRALPNLRRKGCEVGVSR